MGFGSNKFREEGHGNEAIKAGYEEEMKPENSDGEAVVRTPKKEEAVSYGTT